MSNDTFSRNEARMARADRERRELEQEQERDTFLEADRDRVNWNNVAARLERLRPLRDEFAAQIASENAKQIADFYTMDDSIDIANAIRESGLSEITVIADLVRLNNRHERELAALRSELADLRTAQSADPTGAHPYRSTATKAPSRAVAASDRAERGEGRSGAWRRVYGALARNWWLAVAAVGFSFASAQAFDVSPTASGALAGIAGIALVRVGLSESER